MPPSNEFTVLAPAESNAEAIQQARELLRAAPEAEAVVVCVSAPRALMNLRRTLPGGLAVLIARPDPRDVVVVRGSDAASDSAWETLLRASRNGKPILWQESGDIDAGDQQLPRLAPSAPPTKPAQLRETLLAEAAKATAGAASRPDAIAFSAGLLQLHDFLDESHSHSQSVEHEGRHRNGDYWHAIMHRREPDFGNSGYWFRHVGRHPIFPELAAEAQRILRASDAPEAPKWEQRLVERGEWQPHAFVDLCSQCIADEEAPLSVAARRIQWTEMLLLLEQTWRDAMGA